MESQFQHARRKRRQNRMMSVLRYVFGIAVLAIFFTISHLLLVNPNDGAESGDTDAILDAQYEMNGY